MEITIPTTKEEMFSTLKSLFAYYRYNREEYVEQELVPLNIEEMTFNELSTEELKSKARELLKPKHEEKLMEARVEIQKKIDEISYKVQIALVASEKAKENYASEYWKDYEEQIDNMMDKHKHMLNQYNLIYTGMAEFTLEEHLQTIEQKHQAILAVLQKQLEDYQQELENVAIKYSSLFEKEINAKYLELLDEQEKTKREVYKYNNAIEEKKQRYANTLKQANANLKLKLISIRSEPLPKETLIDLGYYDKAMDVVFGYYNRLSAVDAFLDISNEPTLALYLEDYFQDIVYLYRMKAY